MKKNARQAAEGVRQDLVARELRRVAMVCPAGVEQKIILQVRREHREATAPDRALVRDVRDRGGICFPGGMTAEEWRNRLPRALHGKRGRCVPADEIAQEMADRGVIREPSSDAALDHLDKVYTRAKSEPSLPDKADLDREAKRIVREKVTRAVRELVRTARRQAEAACPAPESPLTTEG